MKVILAIVTSVDSKSTKGNSSPKNWASSEDQQFFSSQIKKHDLIIMGKNTYLVQKPYLKLSQNKLRLVLTRDPKRFQKDSVENQLEFSSESPKKLVKRLSLMGYKEALLVSGASLNTAFFKDKLISELWLTLEPKIFGLGKSLVDNLKVDTSLKLKSIKKLNSQGTLLLKYEVL